MFENLTSQQKIMFVLISILALICLFFALYFGLSKKSCPQNKSKQAPSLVKFAIRADPPSSRAWKTPTYYKYSYTNSDEIEGDLSDSSEKVSSETESNPIMQVEVKDQYTIKVYRAVNTSSASDFKPLDVVVDTEGKFTDTDNPYQPPTPPTPNSVPKLIDWKNGGGGGLKCPEKPTKCTGQCDTIAPCPVNNWKCTDGVSNDGCSIDPNKWENTTDCKQYCYTAPSATNKSQRQR